MSEGKLLEMLMQWLPMIWLVIAVIFGVIEAATVQLMSIWFAIGAVAAMIASLLGAGVWVQFAVFLIVAIIVLAFTRPMVKKVLKVGHVHTNADSVIGRIGAITVDIPGPGEVGRVLVDGQDWSAISEDGSFIPKGERVLVKSIEGVKLVVEPMF
ncbi:MAG: NfeD family protein [Oscillospiraceae bacterium]|nr:NfeD family protein [Oscillospiraceae bacterium]